MRSEAVRSESMGLHDLTRRGNGATDRQLKSKRGHTKYEFQRFRTGLKNVDVSGHGFN